jgi:hypothetical protein
MIDVKLRYNTLVDDNHLYWRIIIDGVERTASDVVFEIPVRTTRDDVFDPARDAIVNKHHVSCTANEIIWEDDKCTIK